MSEQTPSFPPPDDSPGLPAEPPPVSQDVPAPSEPVADVPAADVPAADAAPGEVPAAEVPPAEAQPEPPAEAAPAPVPAPPPTWPQQATPPAAPPAGPPAPPAYPPQTYPAQGYPAGGYPPGGYPQHPETSSNAVIALILAIVSWVVCPIIPAIVALFLANTATKEIAASGGRKTGDGLVTASKIVSWINIGVWGAAIVIGFFFFILAIVAGGFASN